MQQQVTQLMGPGRFSAARDLGGVFNVMELIDNLCVPIESLPCSVRPFYLGTGLDCPW